MKELIFVSSVQKELARERQAICDFIRGDTLLGQYFDVFLFEDLPANNQTPGQVYIAEVDRSAIYLGIFGNEYGWKDDEGISPTEREFDRATEKRKKRLVFVKNTDDSARNEKMKALIKKAKRQLTRRRAFCLSLPIPLPFPLSDTFIFCVYVAGVSQVRPPTIRLRRPALVLRQIPGHAYRIPHTRSSSRPRTQQG